MEIKKALNEGRDYLKKNWKMAALGITTALFLGGTLQSCDTPKQDDSKQIEESKESTPQVVDSNTAYLLLSYNDPMVDSLVRSLDINQEIFNDIATFIEKKGFKVYDGDYQYTFFDSHGSRHALIYSPSNNSISVWAYKNGKRSDDLDNFVGWHIMPDRVVGQTPQTLVQDYESIRRGYEEFKSLVEKSKSSTYHKK